MNFPRRKRLRLQSIQYSEPGAYFLTICSYQRICRFGKFINGQLVHNPIGIMIVDEWRGIPSRYPRVSLDEFILMPNHLHGIYWISEMDHKVPQSSPVSIPRIIQWFKSTTTRAAKKLGANMTFDPRINHLWQRSYFDRVIRSEEELRNIRAYIVDNPVRWQEDQYYYSE